MKKLIPLILMLLFAVVLTSCAKQQAEESAEPPVIESEKPTPTPTPTETPEPFRNKLTGEIVEEEPDNSRPFAVMINNYIYALPHCGVSQADIIYEVLAEGEITRMMPIFSDISDAGVLGSMRSSRPYYIEIARSYDAIYVHAGGSDQAYADIASKGVENIDGVNGAYGAEIFYRDPNRMSHGSEHSLFTTGEKLLEYMPKFGYRSEHETENFDYGMTFADEIEMENAKDASSVIVSFSGLKTTTFTYDEGGFYTGAQFGSDYIDGNTGEAVQFRNLLVLYADTKVLDSDGRRSVELNGTGGGHFFCDGKMVDITWSRSGNGEKFAYLLSDGSALTLGVGKTYIAIVPTGSTITAN